MRIAEGSQLEDLHSVSVEILRVANGATLRMTGCATVEWLGKSIFGWKSASFPALDYKQSFTLI
jgi:hypothetical protein